MIAEMDSEDRRTLAFGAMEGLASLIEGQMPGQAIDCDTLAPLVRLVMDAGKAALPSYDAGHPMAVND